MDFEIPFDAVTTLLVFLIGVPAIVLQTLPPELRRVVTKRWPRLLLELSIPAAFAMAVTIGGVLLVGHSPADPRWTWTALLGVLFLTAVYTAFRFFRGFSRRNAIVRRLEQEVGRTIGRSGRLVEDSLHDLVELGKSSEPGREKEWVLESLFGLADRVCAGPDYRGDGLEDLVMGTLEVVLTESPLQSAQNFSTATAVLKRIVLAYDGRPEGRRQVDLIHAIRGLSKLGRASLQFEDPAYALGIVQALGPTRGARGGISVSQALFEVGVAAVEHGQMLVAVASLERLVTLVESRKPARGELVADTFGLLAHFWNAGPTGRGYAHARLERVRGYLEEELGDTLEEAARHCAQTMQFRTADLVGAMRADLLRP